MGFALIQQRGTRTAIYTPNYIVYVSLEQAVCISFLKWLQCYSVYYHTWGIKKKNKNCKTLVTFSYKYYFAFQYMVIFFIVVKQDFS